MLGKFELRTLRPDQICDRALFSRLRADMTESQMGARSWG